LKRIDSNRKIGTQAYCMGGPIAFRTAAAVSDRVGTVASFHGGGLVTDRPNSPHLREGSGLKMDHTRGEHARGASFPLATF
jgi:dienelactone hydrolase